MMMIDTSTTLTERIRAGAPEAFEVILTPADALELLELNTSNRVLRSHISVQYARDMISHRWRYAAEPLKFDTEGILLDGQHRLMALATLADSHPDTIIKFLIVTGLDGYSQTVMDQGSRRTAGDNLNLAGIKNGHNIAASARIYLLWTQDRLFQTNSQAGSGKASNTETQVWVEEHPETVKYMQEALRHAKNIDAPVGAVTAAFARFKEIDSEAADDFLLRLGTGANLYEGHPILTLRERLARIRRDRTKTSTRDYLAFLIIAWNAYRAGITMTKFQRPRGGAWSQDNFPQPI